ncbi:MAG: hypothetical protein KDC65_12215, partial [Saprospiraceae bacterium]|nr:hypothetical protein [Saprospiraceae bacterium]
MTVTTSRLQSPAPASMMFAFCLLVSGIVIPRNVTAQILPPDALKSIHIRSIGPAAMSGRITAITCDPKHPEVI